MSDWSLVHSGDADDASGSSDWSQVSGAGNEWGSFLEDRADEASFTDSESKSKLAVVYLIDFTHAMTVATTVNVKREPSENVSKSDRANDCLTVTIDAVVASLKQKIISTPDDLIGVCLMGTARKADNHHGFANIHRYLPLQTPSAAMIKAVNDLNSANVRDSIGVGDEASLDLFNALWSCQAMFTNTGKSIVGASDSGDDDYDESMDGDTTNAASSSSLSSRTSKSSLASAWKKILIFTVQDVPVSLSSDATQRQRAINKAKDLREQDIEIDLLPFSTTKQSFDVRQFYSSILAVPSDESMEDWEHNYRSKFEDLVDDVIRKQSKKRSLGSVHWTLGHSQSLAVKIYVLYHELKRESPKFLSKLTNQPLTAETKFVDTAGGFIEKDQIIKYFPFGTEKAYFSEEEIKAIKTVDEPGLKLLGFKPINRVKPYHNYRSGYFLQPDESTVRGSSRAFFALVMQCAQMQRCAIVRLIYRKHTAPRLAALLPQLEEKNKHGTQLLGPGFHLVFLPYADDIRQLTFQPAPIADAPMVDSAKSIIAKLTQKQFDPKQIKNPTLQRHYAAVEAMALGEKLREVEDELQPDPRIRTKQEYVDLFEEFNKLVFKGAKPERKDTKNRTARGAAAKTAGAKRSVKREAKDADDDNDDEYADYDWEALKVETVSGGNKRGLGKLTIAQLKVYLLRHGLEKSGRKDDLIERIAAHQPA